jgi:hypothetical protein
MPESNTALAVIEPLEVTRAEVCRLHLMQLGSEIQRSFITMGRLLKDVWTRPQRAKRLLHD